jgi:hypothetical protein
LVNITYIPVAILSLMMLYGIVTGHSIDIIRNRDMMGKC